VSRRLRIPLRLLAGALLLAGVTVAQAQDLEPRRWTHLPTGLNVVGLATTYTDGEIFLDPVLEIEDGEFEVAAGAFAYLRTFSLFGRSARVQALVPYATGRWEGLLSGEPASVRRRGPVDPRLRLSVLLYGGPAQDAEAFFTSPKSNTIVGAAVAVTLPWGDYFDDRLINLGGNRWVIRPQLGVTHMRGKWTGEITGSLFFYGDNDRFFNGSRLENDSLWAVQTHLIYTFRPGLWASLSMGYGEGADAAVDGTDRGARTENFLTGLSLGLPIDRSQGVKLSWIRSRAQFRTGSDFDSVVLAWSRMF
jgi:hypothetical protein